MAIFHLYGSDNRLFEIMQKVNKLNEALLPIEQKGEVIEKFVGFAGQELGLGEDVPNIIISYDNKEAETMKSFGKYTPQDSDIRVVAVNRNLADVLRTLAHELVHYRQNKDGRLDASSNETGSEVENEANAMAGVLMRNFGMQNPIIFE